MEKIAPITTISCIYPTVNIPSEHKLYYFERQKLKSLNSPEQDSIIMPLARKEPSEKLPKLNSAEVGVPDTRYKGKEGLLDKKLVNCCKKIFDNQDSGGYKLHILNNKCVNMPKKRPVPDCIVLCQNEDSIIKIAIENDEPYYRNENTGNTEICHEIGNPSDIYKETELAKNGWFLIRFAESQIRDEVEGCCKYIAELIDSLTEKTKFADMNQFKNVITVKKTERWTKQMAEEMRKNRVREKDDRRLIIK